MRHRLARPQLARASGIASSVRGPRSPTGTPHASNSEPGTRRRRRRRAVTPTAGGAIEVGDLLGDDRRRIRAGGGRIAVPMRTRSVRAAQPRRARPSPRVTGSASATWPPTQQRRDRQRLEVPDVAVGTTRTSPRTTARPASVPCGGPYPHRPFPGGQRAPERRAPPEEHPHGRGSRTRLLVVRRRAHRAVRGDRRRGRLPLERRDLPRAAHEGTEDRRAAQVPADLRRARRRHHPGRVEGRRARRTRAGTSTSSRTPTTSRCRSRAT